jgi:hypothetical protein
MAAKKYGQTLRIGIFFGHLHLRIEGFRSAYIARNRMKAAPMTASEQTITKQSRSNRITKSRLRQNLAVRLPTTANFVLLTRANSLFSCAIVAEVQ